ncbi:hypothetical protein DFQ28_000787 [Apophysomyces sp. BC1034]|nr:hypothetical protein DFQ30_000161 [Apophysomyces sp. BC1015]KAG0181375.1 hypothetical protein DFQ29_008513 [Apophysomyces sp. BC1021]KAG0191184.1 hypothetical protein DFQ28_000787 [Apophysomyces sp. BC1034]
MRATLIIVLLLCLCLHFVAAGPGTHRYKDPHSNYGAEKKTKEHIKEHIKSMLKTGDDLPDLDDQDMIYYLFVIHDLNNDGYLDGHELRAAFTDFEEDEPNPTQFVALDEVSVMVDHVLEEDDLNGE